MSRVAIVTDTTGYLPADVVEANQITQVSLYINWGSDRTERDADITDRQAFMEELRTGEHLPTTSQPSVGDFMAAYEPLLADGADVVSVHISGGISGTVESARQAAQQLERDGKGGERVHVFDSATAAGGQGIVTLGAARSALRGNDVAQVLADTQATRDALKMWFMVDTLEFLKRSGRMAARRR